ncbi:MAG: hypothetical protein EBS70_05845, partial [Actinobacteria bacterium]|nr:hypothetical protein [Actinomycetota bacterium]
MEAMFVMQAVFAATGADTVQDWLRTDLPAIIMTVSGAYVLSRFIAFVADQQILAVKSRNPDTGDLSRAATGAHRAAVVGALRWGLNFAIIAVATTSVLLRLNI